MTTGSAAPRVPAGWLLAAAVADLPLAVVAVSYWWWRERLPDPLPIHWGADGRVDGTAPRPRPARRPGICWPSRRPSPRLSVDAGGLHVGFGPWGWPRLTVPLREIAYAEVVDVRPAEWGGWGYRARSGGRGLVLRRGPGVRLELSAGRHFVATARDADRVAGLLNALLDDVDRDARAAPRG
jgi:hypothetical protein